jgi:hypothetical protein
MRKACPLMAIGIPGTFTVKRKTVLGFMKGISKGTFRAIIALKQICCVCVYKFRKTILNWCKQGMKYPCRS